jgi:NAD(P)-dependent dehydrogenase (short-subunit alcohol dehydrogenase family)
VANAASVCALAERVRALCALDVVVLNAGYSGPVVLRVGEGAPGDFADVLAVNVQATYLVAHYFVPVLLDAGGARALVVVNSLASCITAGPIANTAYCVSKFAQARLVEFVAEQYRAQGVVAVAVHPGAVLTEMADETTPESFRPHLVDSVDLCGAFCVWLTREKRAWLSGRLVSAKWDVDELLAKKTEVEEQDLLKFGFRVRDVAAVE